MIEKRKKLWKSFESIPMGMGNASKHFPPNKNLVEERNKKLIIEAKDGSIEPFETHGTVIFKLWPKPTIVFQLETSNQIFEKYHLKGKFLVVKKADLIFECFIKKITSNNFENHVITLKIRNNIAHSSNNKKLSYATFYLLNFPLCFGEMIQSRNKKLSSSANRIVFSDEQWKVTLDKMESYKELEKEMEESDGFVITYAGKIESISGEGFTSKKIFNPLNKLYWLLTFARGAQTAPILIDGYDQDTNTVWQDWSIRSTDRWLLTQNNWFSSHHVNEIFRTILPGWNKIFENNLWSQEIPKVLYWYSYAGRNTEGAGTDGSNIIATSALELLAFNYLVRFTNDRTKIKFEDKPLSNNLFRMLEDLNIPIRLPEELINLKTYSLNKDWQTGPKAITELRNEVVHPARESAPSSIVCFEALQLSLWYIEMVILKLCGYDGIYSNRLKPVKWEGEIEEVPWKKIKK